MDMYEMYQFIYNSEVLLLRLQDLVHTYSLVVFIRICSVYYKLFNSKYERRRFLRTLNSTKYQKITKYLCYHRIYTKVHECEINSPRGSDTIQPYILYRLILIKIYTLCVTSVDMTRPRWVWEVGRSTKVEIVLKNICFLPAETCFNC